MSSGMHTKLYTALFLKWNLTDVNSVPALEILSSAYSPNLCFPGEHTAHLKVIAHVPPDLLHMWHRLGFQGCMGDQRCQKLEKKGFFSELMQLVTLEDYITITI
jgi:hypothetical protein